MKTLAKVAATPDTSGMHDAERALVAEGQVRDQLEQILGFVRAEAQALELHEVERAVFDRLLRLGQALVVLFLAEKGTGKAEAGCVTTSEGVELPYHSVKVRESYLSIFGKVPIRRAYYWGQGADTGQCPLDAQLNLPKQRYSYLLQEWGELLGVDGSFEQVTERLGGLLGVKFWTQGVQDVARTAAADVQAFYEQKPPPEATSEGELLVATIDGKGVPIRPEKPRGRKLRLGPGEKPNKKKEAVVSAVYTVDRHVPRLIHALGGMTNEKCPPCPVQGCCNASKHRAGGPPNG